MEWWMLIVGVVTWPFAGMAALEYTVWYDNQIPSVPRWTRHEHVRKLALAALGGWLFVLITLLAGGCDGDYF